MNEPMDEMEEGKLGDPFKIDYRLLPEAKLSPAKPPSLWELFLLGSQPFAPHFPPEATAPRKRRGA